MPRFARAVTAALSLPLALLLGATAVTGPADAARPAGESQPGQPRFYGTLLSFHHAKLQACKESIRDGDAWRVWVRGNNAAGDHGHMFAAKMYDSGDEVRDHWQVVMDAGDISAPRAMTMRRGDGRWMFTGGLGERGGLELGGGWPQGNIAPC